MHLLLTFCSTHSFFCVFTIRLPCTTTSVLVGDPTLQLDCKGESTDSTMQTLGGIFEGPGAFKPKQSSVRSSGNCPHQPDGNEGLNQLVTMWFLFLQLLYLGTQSHCNSKVQNWCNHNIINFSADFLFSTKPKKDQNPTMCLTLTWIVF